jgi:hypothetical protein
MSGVWSRGSAASGLAVLVALAAAGAGTVQPTAESVDLPDDDESVFAINTPPIADLYPGAVHSVPVTVVNPYPDDLQVTLVTGSLSWTSDPRCPASPANLTVGDFQGALPLLVPAHGSSPAGTIPVSMPDTAANSCQQVTFVVYLRGSATKVQQ